MDSANAGRQTGHLSGGEKMTKLSSSHLGLNKLQHPQVYPEGINKNHSEQCLDSRIISLSVNLLASSVGCNRIIEITRKDSECVQEFL